MGSGIKLRSSSLHGLLLLKQKLIPSSSLSLPSPSAIGHACVCACVRLLPSICFQEHWRGCHVTQASFLMGWMDSGTVSFSHGISYLTLLPAMTSSGISLKQDPGERFLGGDGA